MSEIIENKAIASPEATIEDVKESLSPIDKLDEKTPDLAKAFKEAYDEEAKKNIKPIPEAPQKEYTDIEKQAMAQGWDPTGEKALKVGKRHLSAEEFVERGELFARLENQKSEINKLKTMVKEVGTHLSKTQESAYQKALEELDRNRQAAVKEGDIKSFQAIEAKMYQEHQKLQQIRDVTKEPPTAPVVPQKVEPSEAVKEFYERNKFWVNKDTPENERMVQYAIAAEEFLAIRQPNLNDKDRISIIESDVKRTFPHRFENEKRSEPSTVLTNTTKALPKVKSNLIDRMSERQKKLGREMVAMELYKSLDLYADDLELQGNLAHE